MLEPVGSLPPAVYWRRRLVLLVLLVLLVVITGWALFGGGGKGGAKADPLAAGASSAAGGPAGAGTGNRITRTSGSKAGGATKSRSTRTASTKTSGSGLSATKKSNAKQCQAQSLAVLAQTGAKSYPVNSTPDLYLQVTNVGTRPCRQDLADKQIELQITSGDVRVWGSHDCAVEPGVAVVTLLPNQPVKREVVWSGQTSVPGCTGTRLVAQAGTYELTSTLDKQVSVPVAFRLTAAR